MVYTKSDNASKAYFLLLIVWMVLVSARKALCERRLRVCSMVDEKHLDSYEMLEECHSNNAIAASDLLLLEVITARSLWQRGRGA